MKSSTNLKRRDFLLTVGLGGAGAAAVLVGGKAVPTQKAAEDKHAPGSGYRMTEHIRNYYRTTRV